MSKKKDKGLLIEVDGEPIKILQDLTPLRGETINLLVIDDASFIPKEIEQEFFKSITPNKPSSERKRRLRLLK